MLTCGGVPQIEVAIGACELLLEIHFLAGDQIGFLGRPLGANDAWSRNTTNYLLRF